MLSTPYDIQSLPFLMYKSHLVTMVKQKLKLNNWYSEKQSRPLGSINKTPKQFFSKPKAL